MSTSSLAKRLQKLLHDGSLTIRDLQVWLGRPYPTVRWWVVGVQEPWHIWRDDIETKISKLETLVRERKHFPVPASYSAKDRRELIQGLVDERDARISRKRAAG